MDESKDKGDGTGAFHTKTLGMWFIACHLTNSNNSYKVFKLGNVFSAACIYTVAILKCITN